MIPDTTNVEEGFHSSPTSPRNTKKTTDGEALSSITSRWRHKRSTIFVAVTVMTVSIAVSVGVVLSSRRNKHVKQEVNPMAASGGHDDTTIIAEVSSGDHRSSIVGQCNVMQELEAPKIDASSAKVAIDGNNLVVVSHGAMQYGYDPHLDGEHVNPGLVEPSEFNVYVDFYSLTDNGWEKVAVFQENDVRASYWDYGQRNVALSGKTCVVTFPSNEDASDRPVYTYRQNEDGIWNKVSLNLPGEGGKCLRGSVDVDQDLMVTVDDTQCGYCYRKNSAHIYKRSGGSWAEAGEVTFDELPDLLNVYQVALSGDTLAVQVFDGCTFYDANESECYINIYKYNREFGTITLEENFIGLPSKCSPMVFDGNYLVHGLSVYHKPGIHYNEPFSLLTTAYPSPASGMVPTGYGKSLALDNGILVVGSDDRTYIFDLQNGAIGEEIYLDQKPNDTHEISNGMLVTSNQDVFGVTILNFNCKQPFPAQTPRPTEAPPTQHSTASPSSYPTYFGTSLGAGIERTFSPSPAPTFVGSMPPNLFGLPSTMAYCSSEEECRDNHDGSFSQFVSGNYRNYGCFSKGRILYWGKGGTSEQEMDDSDFLDGMKERVFCVWN
jgi:hypothetical protein